MKVINVLSSKAIRFIQGSTPSGSVFMPKVVRLLQDKFRFVQVPTTLAEFDASKGVRFFHGEFNGIVIESFEIYENGVLAQTRTNTNDCDLFIDEVLKLASGDLGFQFIGVPHMKKSYVSELDVVIDKNISAMFAKFDGVLKLINKTISQYGDEISPCEGVGFIISGDVIKSPYVKPGRFALDRKAGQSFDTDVYYTTAPLPTEVHLEVLREIERVL